MIETKCILEPGKVFPATADPIFKNLLKDVSCRPFLAKIISFTTGLDYKLLLKNMKLVDNNTLEDSKAIKHNEQDIMIAFDNKRINIEMSVGNKNINIIKNNTTAHKMCGNLYKTSDDYTKELAFYQIVIEKYHHLKNNKLITKTGMSDLDSVHPYPIDKNFLIFYINLLNIPQKCYNELNEKEKYFMFFRLDDICELEKLCKGDEILEQALRVLKNLTNDPDIISKFENDRITRYATEVTLNDVKQRSEKRGVRRGKKEGRKEGIEIGEKSKQIKIAKKMLEKKSDINFIIECTGLTQEEIEKLM